MTVQLRKATRPPAGGRGGTDQHGLGGHPCEKSKAESFFRTLKMVEVYLNDYQDFEEAYENIARFIEEVCNHKRLHSSLGYLSPVEFENHYLKLRS